MKELWNMFAAFFRIGLFTFGGGYAMLPLLEREVVVRNSWATREELLDYFAIGQCMPGIIAANTATLVGYKKRGVPGALCTTLGVIAPSLLVIMAIASLLGNISHLPAVQHAFAGIRVAVCVLILSSLIKLFTSNVVRKRAGNEPGSVKAFLRQNGISLLLFLGAFVVIVFVDGPPVYVVLGAVICGLLFFRKKGEE